MNGPFLKRIKPVLLVVPPSAKINSLAKFLFSSTIYCLSIMALRAFYFSSSDLPRGIKTVFKQYKMVPIIGIFLVLSVGAKAGLKVLNIIAESNQVT
tara:strand:+ start:490 stop:780 length:291 start_codon:yes stop_codon:yes gene_type:complete